ncbi:MAG: ATP-binding protein [Haloarculaceae archaeon]
MSGSAVWRRLNPSGLVVAATGFFLTRFTVALAAYDDPARFLLVGVVPLVLGLSIAVFGVALTVGAFESRYVRTTALWCLIGVGGMAVLVLLTLYGTSPERMTDPMTPGTRTYLSNFLIGGCFGGTLTGVYAARHKRDRRTQQAQAKRLVVLNTVLRDAVLNSLTAIRGHLELLRSSSAGENTDRSLSVIADQSDELEARVQDVRRLTWDARTTDDPSQVDLVECIHRSVERARGEYPDAEITVGTVPSSLPVWADEMLEHIMELLIENAVEHNDSATPTVELSAERRGTVARLAVADDGPGLPPDQQARLQSGSLEDVSDPSSGFGLDLVALLVESYDGRVDATVTDEGTTVEVELQVADEDAGVPRSGLTNVRSYGVSRSRLFVAGGAALGAGVLMGLFLQLTSGAVPVIGALYGVESVVVGWITHLFHSLVFGIAYVGLLSVLPGSDWQTTRGYLAVGVAWGVVLALGAAGVVMPLWLRALGVAAPLPNVSPVVVLGHLLWGGTLALLYAGGLTLVDD